MNELIAGRRDRDRRPPSDEKASLPDGGGDGDGSGVEPRPAPQNHLAAPDLGALGCDVLAGRDGGEDDHPLGTFARILHHRDRIRALGNGGARHDRRRLSAADAKVGIGSRGNAAHELQPRGNGGGVFGAQREPVDGGAPKRRQVGVGGSVLAKHPAPRVGEIDLLRRQRRRAREDDLEGSFDGNHGFELFSLSARTSSSSRRSRSFRRSSPRSSATVLRTSRWGRAG